MSGAISALGEAVMTESQVAILPLGTQHSLEGRHMLKKRKQLNSMSLNALDEIEWA